MEAHILLKSFFLWRDSFVSLLVIYFVIYFCILFSLLYFFHCLWCVCVICLQYLNKYVIRKLIFDCQYTFLVIKFCYSKLIILKIEVVKQLTEPRPEIVTIPMAHTVTLTLIIFWCSNKNRYLIENNVMSFTLRDEDKNRFLQIYFTGSFTTTSLGGRAQTTAIILFIIILYANLFY